MIARSLRRWLHFLGMLAIIISVLVACNTGDTPIAIAPPQVEDPSTSSVLSDPEPIAAPVLGSLQTRVLYSDFSSPQGVTVDGDTLVVADQGGLIGREGGLVRVPIRGGSAELIATGQIGKPTDVIVDGDAYIVTDQQLRGRLWRVPKVGGAPSVIAVDLGNPINVDLNPNPAYANSYLVVDSGVRKRLLRVGKDGSVSEIAINHDLREPFGFTTDHLTNRPVLTDINAGQILVGSLPLSDYGPGYQFSSLDLRGLIRPAGIAEIRQHPSGPDRFLLAEERILGNQGRLLELNRSQPGSIEGVIYEGGNPRHVAVINYQVYAFTDPRTNTLVLVEAETGSEPSPLPTPQDGATVEILNAAQVDGIPLQVGQTTTVEAVAFNLAGEDISDQIQWVDHDGMLLGTGRNLTYQAKEVVMETLTARYGGVRSRVSFTISAPDYVMAPHVKALPNDAPELVVSRNRLEGILQLKQDDRIPTLQVGDVVLGAGLLVPPLQVVEVTAQEENLVLQVEAAGPTQVIEEGDFPSEMWESAVWSRAQNKLIMAGSEDRSSLAETESCVFAGFTFPRVSFESGGIKLVDPIQEELTLSIPEEWEDVFVAIEEPAVNASLSQIDGFINGSFCPVITANPRIKFEGFRLTRFEIEAGQEAMDLEAFISGGGMGRVETSLSAEQIPIPIPLPENVPIKVAPIGVIPVFLTVGFTDLLSTIRINPSAEARIDLDRLGIKYRGLEYVAKVGYDASREEGKEWEASVERSSFPTAELIRELSGAAQGNIELQFQPEIGVGVWADLLPIEGVIDILDDPLDFGGVAYYGLEFTLGVDLELSTEEEIIIDSPETEGSYSGSEEVSLKGYLGKESPATAQFYAGVDLTVGGGIEEDKCSVTEEKNASSFLQPISLARPTPASRSGLCIYSRSDPELSGTTKHIEDAIRKGYPSILTVHKDQLRAKANRRYSCEKNPEGKNILPPLTCDEYPFASTYEGGEGVKQYGFEFPSVRGVPGSENLPQARLMNCCTKALKNGDKIKILIVD